MPESARGRRSEHPRARRSGTSGRSTARHSHRHFADRARRAQPITAATPSSAGPSSLHSPNKDEGAGDSGSNSACGGAQVVPTRGGESDKRALPQDEGRVNPSAYLRHGRCARDRGHGDGGDAQRNARRVERFQNHLHIAAQLVRRLVTQAWIDRQRTLDDIIKPRRQRRHERRGLRGPAAHRVEQMLRCLARSKRRRR